MKPVNTTESTYTANPPIFSVNVEEKNGDKHAKPLQGLGDQRDAIASWVVYRITNPKAKALNNSKLDKNGGWRNMSREASLKAVERKAIKLDEQQDCWQSCMALLLQGVHLKGDPLMLDNGKQLTIGGIPLCQGVYECFAACRDILRINNRKSDYCDSLEELTESGREFAMPHKSEKHGVQRVMRAMAFRENLRLVRLSFSMDKSRERLAKKKNAIRFMIEIADGSISRLSKSARSMRKAAFIKYVGFSKIVQDTNLQSLAQDMTAI
jgi:hypothetical protein